eukprot:302127-Chlamydomonas_euryale.AAC.1
MHATVTRPPVFKVTWLDHAASQPTSRMAPGRPPHRCAYTCAPMHATAGRPRAVPAIRVERAACGVPGLGRRRAHVPVHVARTRRRRGGGGPAQAAAPPAAGGAAASVATG